MSLVAVAALQIGCGSKDKPVEAGAAPAVGEADKVVAGAGDGVVIAPTGAEAGSDGIAPEVLKAIESGRLGCIGVTSDGERALVIHEEGDLLKGFEREALWLGLEYEDRKFGTPEAFDRSVYATACGKEDVPACENGGTAASASETKELLAAATGMALVPCAPTAASSAGCEVRHPGAGGQIEPCIPRPFRSSLDVFPLGKRVSLIMSPEELSFEVEGGARGVVTRFDQAKDLFIKRDLRAFASDKTPHVFVLVVATEDDGILQQESYQVRGSELGIEPCVPVEAKTLEAKELGPVPEKAIDVGCFAMSGDGKSAMMAVASADTMMGVDETGTVQLVWAGDDLGGTLDCFADSTTCAGEDTPARKAFIEKHGLTACPKPTTDVVVSGTAYPIVSAKDRLWWKHPTLGRRWLKTFEVEANDGGRHESFFAAWQHPKGGPLFVLYSNEDTGLTEKLATAIPTAAFGVCAAAR